MIATIKTASKLYQKIHGRPPSKELVDRWKKRLGSLHSYILNAGHC